MRVGEWDGAWRMGTQLDDVYKVIVVIGVQVTGHELKACSK